VILHIDMDAFFAAIEQRDNPALKGRCVLVGRDSGRGVVAAASYEARAFGVHSAMPMVRARRLCPAAIVVPPRKAAYQEVSGRLMNILMTFSPLVEPVSIDEAFVDVTGCLRPYGTVEEMARTIKKNIAEVTGLSCSVGGAPLKFLAKIASDMNKPAGLTIIPPEAVPRFIETLPIHKVPGVGRVAGQTLALLGIETLGDVARCPREVLLKKLGKFGGRLQDLSLGQDDAAVTACGREKSISTETTLFRDTADMDALRRYLLRQSGEVCHQLQAMGAKARVVFIRIKYDDFSETSRQVTLHPAVCSSDAVYRNAAALLEKRGLVRKVRLIGLGVTNLLFKEAGEQLGLFDDQSGRETRWAEVDRSVSAISEKFGKDAVKRGSLTE